MTAWIFVALFGAAIVQGVKEVDRQTNAVSAATRLPAIGLFGLGFLISLYAALS